MKDSLKLNIDPITKKVKNRETNYREFKAIFDSNKLWMYAKTMAAFANRDGGVIFFGIKDNSKELLGVPEDQLDDTTISNFTKEFFEPEIVFDMSYKEYNGINLLCIIVQPCKNKPVICKKKKIQQEKGAPTKHVLNEGTIYYRYSTSTVDIKYPALREMLDNSVKKAVKDFTDTMNMVSKIGHERFVIIDEKNLIGKDKKTPVYITDETVDNIKWIRKGQFTQEDTGDKAMVVVGETEFHKVVEVEKGVDYNKTHCFIQRSLAKVTSIRETHIKAVVWKLGLLENEAYHVSTAHGKQVWHKFTEATKDEILKHYPLDIPNRLEQFIEINKEYSLYKKRKAK